MIISLCEAQRLDLIAKLQHLVLKQVSPNNYSITFENLHRYGQYLKRRYLNVLVTLHLSINKWLPLQTNKIFKLTIIKKERVQYLDHDFIKKITKGQIDEILLQKPSIELNAIFKNIEDEKKVALIEGAPGSGKTTLTVHLCQQWGRGELFNEFTAVILVQLRDQRVQNACSLADLLPCENQEMAEVAAREIIATEGSGILWVLDGWDEFPVQLQKQSVVSTLIQQNLHQDTPLSKTTIIITSRPIALSIIHPLVSVRTEILGFTSKELIAYLTECLNNDERAVKMLMESLSINPAIEGSCYLPLNASIVAHLYQTKGSLPSTVYGIFSSVVQHCLSRYLHERLGMSHFLASFESLEELPHELQIPFQQLCKLAFKGVMENKVTFSTSNLAELKITPEICELGLLQAVPSIVSHGSSVYHNFIHFAIQELLAAIHISQIAPEEQILKLDSMFNDDKFSSVLQFYAAITKFRTSRPNPSFFKPTGIPDSVYKLIRNAIRKNSKYNTNLLVSLLNCLYEAQDVSLCKYVANELRSSVPFIDRFGKYGNDLDLCLHLLVPRDCLSIGYFLACVVISFRGEFKVTLHGCTLEDIGIKILMQSLCRTLDAHQSDCRTGQLKLYFSSNKISNEGVLYIADVLKSTSALKKLSLSDNSISDGGLLTIAEALTNNTSLVKLKLSWNSLWITERNGTALAKLLQHNKTLATLDLSYNSAVSDAQISFILEGLNKNTTLKRLRLTGCNITDGGFHLLQSCTSTCKIIKKK